jgi:hypothetical protein
LLARYIFHWNGAAAWLWIGIAKLNGRGQLVAGKTGWDLLSLLLVPAALAAVAAWFSSRQKQYELEVAARDREKDRDIAARDREVDREIAQKSRDIDQQIADDRQQEQALETYLKDMSDLMTDTEPDSGEQDGTTVFSRTRMVARARTIAILHRLNSQRNRVALGVSVQRVGE